MNAHEVGGGVSVKKALVLLTYLGNAILLVSVVHFGLLIT